MVNGRVEPPVYQIASDSQLEEPKEANYGGSSTEGSEPNSVRLVISDEEPDVDSKSEHEEEETEGSESADLGLTLNSLTSGSLKFSSKKPKFDMVAELPSKPVSLKRAPVDLKESEGKKPKQNHLFQRLWSEEDEIIILKGIINYVAQNNADPLADVNAFRQFIKKDLHINVSIAQLQRKIRRLRKKFQNNKKKEKDGKHRTFSKSHEQEAYGLSKTIWNIEGKIVGVPTANDRALSKKKMAVVGFNAADCNDRKFMSVSERRTMNFLATGDGTVRERIMKIGDELFEGEKASTEGGQQWRSLKAQEIELYIAQLEVKKAQAKLVLDILKS